MHTDSIGRRTRSSQPAPWGTQLRLRKRDWEKIFKNLQRGPLPIGYLHELDPAVNYNALQHRLTDLYHGYCENRVTHVRDSDGRLPPDHFCKPVTFVSRPPDQDLTRKADYKELVYDLTEHSLATLQEKKDEEGKMLFSPYYLARRSTWWVHDFMASCVNASLEIAIGEAGNKFLTLDDIFNHDACPKETRDAPNPLSVRLSDGKHLVPDDLFGIMVPGDKPTFHFYAVEIDRASESLTTQLKGKEKRPPTIESKILGYEDLLSKRLYGSHWGLPNLRVLIVTNNAYHAHSIVTLVEKTIKNTALRKRFAVKSRSEFGKVWTVPEVMRDLYAESWYQSDGLFYLNRP